MLCNQPLFPGSSKAEACLAAVVTLAFAASAGAQPEPQPDVEYYQEDMPSVFDVLDNDRHASSLPRWIENWTPPPASAGSLDQVWNGVFRFEPAPGQRSDVVFTYQVRDPGSGVSGSSSLRRA